MSEENNISSNQLDAPIWETQLLARANESFNQRLGPLKAEIERFQSTINELNSKLTEQIQPTASETDSAGLVDLVKEWFKESSSEAERKFESRLISERAEWESITRQSSEDEFQKRMEHACAEASVIARRQAEAQVEDLREQLEASRNALTLALSSNQSAALQASGFENIKSSIEDIDTQRTQSDTLSALVRRASQFAPRIVFFVIKGSEAIGWKASGFDNGLNDDTVRQLSISIQNPTLLREALTTFKVAISGSSSPGEKSSLSGVLGLPAPETALAIPLVIRGKAAAVLYADSGTQSENAIAGAALETLMRVASMGIELLPSRRGVESNRPTPTPAQLSSSTLSEPMIGAVHLPVKAPAPVIAPMPQAIIQATIARTDSAHYADEAYELAEPKRITEELSPTSIEQIPETPVALHSARTEPGLEVEADADATLADEPSAPIFNPQILQAIIPPPPPPPPVFVSTLSRNDFAEPVNFDIHSPINTPEFASHAIPPPLEAQPPVQAAPSVPIPTSETEQRAHNDARRFARLLVSEIKLYNATKVSEGRRNFDLYLRLKEEIDRSRKVYDKRVSPAVATKFDYFYDELVQTLAEGEAVKLGANCPGPVVL